MQNKNTRNYSEVKDFAIFLLTKCPRKKDIFTDCLVQDNNYKIFLNEFNKFGGLIRFIAHEKVNTDIIDHIIGEVSSMIEYEIDEQIKKELGIILIKQLVVCSICRQTFYEFYNKKLELFQAKKVYEAFCRHYIKRQSKEIICAKIFLDKIKQPQSKERLIDIPQEINFEEKVNDDILINSGNDLKFIKEYIQDIEVNEPELLINKNPNQIYLEKHNEPQIKSNDEQKLREIKKSGILIIDESILSLNIDNSTKEEFEALIEYLNRFSKCSYCENRNHYDRINDCPKITEKVIKIVEDKDVARNWKDKKIRYCLAREYQRIIQDKISSL